MKASVFALFSVLSLSIFAGTSVRLDFEVRQSQAQEVGTIFVIDNSGSMGPHQDQVIQKSSAYFQQLTQITNNFGVTVLSTDISEKDYGIVTHENTDPTGDFSRIVSRLGTSGDATELVIDSINKFINSTEGQAFLMDKTFLNIVIISDEEEQSQMSAQEFVSSLPLPLTKLNISSIVSKPACGGWDPDGRNAKYEELASLTQGATFSICEDYTPAFQSIVNSIGTRLPANPQTGNYVLPFRTFNLRYQPEVSSIEISYGSQIIPYGYFRVGWSYEPKTNRIIFGEDVELDQNQPEGTRLTIKYDSKKSL